MRYRLHFTKEHNTFRAYYLEQFFSQWFETKPFDVKTSFSSKDVLLLSLPECANQIRFSDIPVSVFDNASHILIDNLQEPFLGDLDFLHAYRHKVLVLTAGHGHAPNLLDLLIIPEWFWYFESLWYRSRDYHLYRPSTQQKTHLFFLPIRRQRPGRDLVYQGLSSLLHRSIYSYVEKGVRLPGIPEQHVEDQRWFDASWYDQTYFSVICEDDDDTYPVLWSEKSCKPLAFFHPFILVGQRGLLGLIQSHGFQSFSDIFDESYDTLSDIHHRAAAVCKQIMDLNLDALGSPLCIEKTQHNHARFFDKDLVEQRMTDRLINPILEFLETPK